jgi:hypothetical protein
MRILVAALGLLLAIGGLAAAADVTDKVKVETLSVGLHPGMDPGMYVCAGGHLHIKATVENLASVALGKVHVAGRAFGPGDELLGTATAAVKKTTLAPNEKSEVDLEFLTITGPKIKTVKRHELTVVEAPTRR